MQFVTTRLLTCSLRLPPSSTRLSSSLLRARPLSSASRTLYPRKDSQDKDSINNESTEYSKSGSDDQVARQEDAAFDPNKTDPEDQKETAAKGNEVCTFPSGKADISNAPFGMADSNDSRRMDRIL